MRLFNRIKSLHGKAFVTFLLFIFFLAIIAAAGYFIYNDKDFQRTHRKEINKFNFYLRDFTKTANDFSKKIETSIANWKKSHPSLAPGSSADKKTEPRTYENLLYNQNILGQEVPEEMLRHQSDEITLCSYNADFLLNNPLTDNEITHLANIFRFCDINIIAGLQTKNFIPRITATLKILHYNATSEISAPVDSAKTTYAFIYRTEKIYSVSSAKIYNTTNSFSPAPYYGVFRSNNFDFIIAAFKTPPSGPALASEVPLESFYETLKTENPDIQDIMLFGDFLFQSEDFSWDSNSLLPTVAYSATTKNQSDLLGNFWFRKKDLKEYNGKSGVINIKEELFPSKRNPPVTANKPIWTQFKLMPDDD